MRRAPGSVSNSAALTCLLLVFSFLLFPTFSCFTSAIFQLAFGSSSGLLGVLCDFVSRFANFERCRVFIAVLSFALGISLSFAGVSARTDRQYQK
jgi:hypothetical protein